MPKVPHSERTHIVTSVDNTDKAKQLAKRGQSSFERFKRLHDLEDLDRAIDAQQRAIKLMHEDHPRKLETLGDLGNSLWNRHENLDKLEDLDNAIAVERLALDLTPEGHPERPERLASLATSMHSRFKRLGEIRDLEGAIAADRLALNLMPEGHPDRPKRLANLAISLHSRFQHVDEIRDLEDAIAAKRLALDLTPEDHPDRPKRLASLATSLHSRFERLGDIRDLEDAIAADKEVAEMTPESHPDRFKRLGDLATSLHSRFVRLGEIRDLEDAIAAERLALDLTPEGHPDRHRQLGHLSTFLHSRFERLGEIRDLEDAIAADKEVAGMTPESHPDRFKRLGDLATSLHSRFERLGEIRDLEDAIAAERLALALMPKGHPDWHRRLGHLSTFLRSCFERLGEIRDLEEAIAADKEVAELTPENHPDRFKRLGNLANSLYSRFRRLTEIRDLEDAIAALKLALDLMPEGHPDCSKRHYDLGLSMQTRLKQHQSKMHFDAAFKEFMKATMSSLGNPSVRLLSAQACVTLLSEYPDFGSAESLLVAHSRIVQIFPEIVWLGHSVKRRYEESARLADLVNAAVAAFIGSRSRYQAIEWMEVGRSLVWSQISALREPIDDLELKHSELAKDLRKVSLALQQSGSMSHSEPHELEHSGEETQAHAEVSHSGSTSFADSGGITSHTAEDRHRRLAIEYQDILKKVRKLEGFEDFLHPPSITNRMPSIELFDGPVVFINVHSSSCDALALLPNGAVKHIPLPDLTSDRAHNLQSTSSKLFKAPDMSTARGVVPPARLFLEGRPTNMFGSVLWKIWIWVVHPILQNLDFMKIPSQNPLPHITWCPTGPLTQLPLHAAGIYDFSQSARSQRVFDFVVSSYTTSLSTLLRSHEGLRARPPPSRPNVLVVAQPATPRYAKLPHTKDEGERIGTILTDSTPTLLIDKAATVVDTTAALRLCTWVHLACHGYQNTEDPTQSAFALVDNPLTLGALMSATAENAELAFLSACETAVGDEKNPEESVHLAAGMLAVGFKGVVATMWSIYDVDAPVIVEAYYRKLLELRGSGKLTAGYTGAAYALHEAMKVLRERVGEEKFERWAPFVHFGV